MRQKLAQFIASRKAFLPVYLRAGLLYNDLGMLAGAALVVADISFKLNILFSLSGAVVAAVSLILGIRRLKSL